MAARGGRWGELGEGMVELKEEGVGGDYKGKGWWDG